MLHSPPKSSSVTHSIQYIYTANASFFNSSSTFSSSIGRRPVATLDHFLLEHRFGCQSTACLPLLLWKGKEGASGQVRSRSRYSTKNKSRRRWEAASTYSCLQKQKQSLFSPLPSLHSFLPCFLARKRSDVSKSEIVFMSA